VVAERKLLTDNPAALQPAIIYIFTSKAISWASKSAQIVGWRFLPISKELAQIAGGPWRRRPWDIRRLPVLSPLWLPNWSIRQVSRNSLFDRRCR
jgi:hypothetical protein